MESLINQLRGYSKAEITGARPENLLNLLASNNVEFWGAEPIDDYTLRLTLHSYNVKKLEALAARALCHTRTLATRGAPIYLKRVKKRYTLLLGFVICLLLLLYSSFFIWDIEVFGNETVSAAIILNALEETGVGIGSYWPAFVSDSIRSRVLLKVPELSWITVNVYGSRAEVIVRERVPKPELIDEETPMDIVAEKAGIIVETRVYRGTAQVVAGQTVLTGETLVSSEAISPFAGSRWLHAMADVTARTWHEMTAAKPLTELRKMYNGGAGTRYAVQIGTKRINIYSNSRNNDINCDKIISERKLALGGVFTLPISLIEERFEEYELVSREIDAKTEAQDMQEYLEGILRKRIGDSGQIITCEFSAAEKDGLLLVTLRAECIEQIGKARNIM